MIVRCPSCNLPITNEEACLVACPVCEAELPMEAAEQTDTDDRAKAPPKFGKWFFLTSLAGLLLLVGSVSGFALRPHFDNETTNPSERIPNSANAYRATAKAQRRVKELMTLVSKLGKERDQLKRDIETAQVANKVPDDKSKVQSKRIRELEALTEKLTKERDTQKRLTAEARSQADKVQPPTDDRVKMLESLTAKLQQQVQTAKTEATQAKNREETTRQAAEKYRRDSQKTLDRVRRDGNRSLQKLNQRYQQTINRMRQQNDRALQQVRQQLNQQRQATQRALAKAARQRKRLRTRVRKRSDGSRNESKAGRKQLPPESYYDDLVG